jgi:hypothetical protein
VRKDITFTPDTIQSFSLDLPTSYYRFSGGGGEARKWKFPIRSPPSKNKSSELWEIDPDAIQRMSNKNVGALLVMEERRLAGIISESDYTRKLILVGKSSKTTRILEFMTTKGVILLEQD